MNATPTARAPLPELHCLGCNKRARATHPQLPNLWVAQMVNVGWRPSDDGHRCGNCLRDGDGVVARYVDSSSEDKQYELTPSANGWKCQCRGFRTHGHCKHADAENQRDAARAMPVSTPANDDAIPAFVPYPEWIGIKGQYRTCSGFMPGVVRKAMTREAIRLAKAEAWRAQSEADKARNERAWFAAMRRLNEACDAEEVVA